MSKAVSRDVAFACPRLPARPENVPVSLVAAGGQHERANEVAEQYRGHVATLVRRAQDAGVIRADVGVDEVHALLVATSRVGMLVQLDEHVRDGLVTVVLDGLRAGTGTVKPTDANRAADLERH